MTNYYLIVKTGDSELRALEHTSDSVLNSITPVIELTRGRKQPSKEKDAEKKKLEIPKYPYEKKLAKVKEIFAGRRIVMDITSDEGLMSQEIDLLYDPADGYSRWVDFLVGLKGEKCFSEIIPSIIISSEDEDIEAGIANEVEKLTANFDRIVYRSDIFDDNCYDDIAIVKEHLNGKKLIILIDCSYVIQANISNYTDKVKARINNLKRLIPSGTEIIVSATSFPRTVTEIGDDVYDEFKLSEVVMSEDLAKFGLSSSYSDYGSINPVRNDDIIMARGWVPRIDVPLRDIIFYHRVRRPSGVKSYAGTYTQVANETLKDVKFPRHLNGNWGIQQIVNCASGMNPSSAPGFWISVRMCIHIETQVMRLAELEKKRS